MLPGMSGALRQRDLVFTYPKQGPSSAVTARQHSGRERDGACPHHSPTKRGSFVSHLLLAADSVKLNTGNTAWMLYSFILTFILGTVLKRFGVFRVSEDAEVSGIDEAEHAETAYSFSTVLSGGLTGQAAGAAASPSPTAREKVDA